MKTIKWIFLLVLVVSASMYLSGCADSSTHGTEKDIRTTVTFNVSGNSRVTVTSPLSLDSASEANQDTAGTSTISPPVRLQLTEGGSTSAGEGSMMDDITSKLKMDNSKTNSDNTMKEEIPKNVSIPDLVSPAPAPGVSQPGGTTPPATGATKAILWKPVSDSDKKLAVLLPAAMKNPAVSICDISGKEIEKGKFVYYSNPDRATYRFTKTGSGYPSPCLLKVGNDFYYVKTTGSRLESLPIAKIDTTVKPAETKTETPK